MSPGSQPTPIKLTERQKRTLGQITRRQTASQNLVRRANIIMTVAEGMNNQQAAQHLTLHRETVSICSGQIHVAVEKSRIFAHLHYMLGKMTMITHYM